MQKRLTEREIKMNETLKAMEKRFSCRNFNEKVPTDEELTLIAQAAIQSPSGMNRQGWQVIVIKDKALIDEMDEAGMKFLSEMPDKTLFERINGRGGKLFYNAPRMVAIAVKVAEQKGAELLDCGIVAQNIVIAAQSLGLANLHCGLLGLVFSGDRADEFKQRLQFPVGYECGIGILLGHTDNEVAPHIPDQEKITIIE